MTEGRVDDRRFQDLLAEASRLAERRDPGAAHDGRVKALLSGVAHIADEVVFQLNRLPELLRGPLLDVLGLRPARARMARAVLEVRSAGPVTVPRGARVSTVDGVAFSTEHDLRVVPAEPVGALTQVDGGFAQVIDLDQVHAVSPAATSGYYVGFATPLPHCLVEFVFTMASKSRLEDARPTWAVEAWDGEEWQPCAVRLDTTGGLSDSGTMLVRVPDTHVELTISGISAAWIRFRGAAEPDASPIRFRVLARTVGGVVTAAHGSLVLDEPLGTTSGVPGQGLGVHHRPVVGPAPVVEVGGIDGWDTWTVVRDFTGSGAEDRHVVFDGDTLRFGPAVTEDGAVVQRGALPRADALVRVREYWAGGGKHGNVAAGALRALDGFPDVTVTNPLPATGGRDAETVDEVWRRAPFALRARDRAVTAQDYEYLAREAAPELARAHCVLGEDGAINVLLVPNAPSDEMGRVDFNDLGLGQKTLLTVADYLDERRVIGTTVVVDVPRYGGVTVVAQVQRAPGMSTARTHDAALRALYTYLHPIIGGPTGTGWPLGRPVHVGDIYAVLHQVEGVSGVDDVRLYLVDTHNRARGDSATKITVDRDALLFSADHQVRVLAT
ncbi:putative baseplate assembly protein [Actinokineospora diospyrosa]|uniref:Baseplate assembly protein n=1 Tax=Actinokineospora diospyrosa TaxID=103728 RepID=A0ABT1I8N8_9PSEU|nr:putative baseplate assembly protein [Actinokineospora diospyrosa]MCP2268982.1 putative baseplate assembly protein [Actinokineospora diospyrosa]